MKRFSIPHFRFAALGPWLVAHDLQIAIYGYRLGIYAVILVLAYLFLTFPSCGGDDKKSGGGSSSGASWGRRL